MYLGFVTFFVWDFGYFFLGQYFNFNLAWLFERKRVGRFVCCFFKFEGYQVEDGGVMFSKVLERGIQISWGYLEVVFGLVNGRMFYLLELRGRGISRWGRRGVFRYGRVFSVSGENVVCVVQGFFSLVGRVRECWVLKVSFFILSKGKGSRFFRVFFVFFIWFYFLQ